jgi:hypothetical protein
MPSAGFRDARGQIQEPVDCFLALPGPLTNCARRVALELALQRLASPAQLVVFVNSFNHLLETNCDEQAKNDRGDVNEKVLPAARWLVGG